LSLYPHPPHQTHNKVRVTIIPSKPGAAQHPAWFHNLRANPDVTFGGIPMRATVVSDQAECDRIWTLADRVFAPYATYRREAAKVNRTIPIVQLTPEVTFAFWDHEERQDRRVFFGRLSRRRHLERTLSPASTRGPNARTTTNCIPGIGAVTGYPRHVASAIILEQCIFCGGTEMSEEHIVADWVLRAFVRSRKPGPGLAGTFTAPDTLRVEAAEPVQTAEVTCKDCNNGWLALIDNAAAQVLKPLIRGESDVELDTDGQTAFAAWIYKCALIFDAAQHGADGELSSLRAGFLDSRLAGPRSVIYAGPTEAPTPLELPGLEQKLSLRLFAVRPANGTMRLDFNGQVSEIPIPGYQVLLGNLCVYLGGQVQPIAAESLVGFEQMWPAREEPVVVRPWLVGGSS